MPPLLRCAAARPAASRGHAAALVLGAAWKGTPAGAARLRLLPAAAASEGAAARSILLARGPGFCVIPNRRLGSAIAAVVVWRLSVSLPSKPDAGEVRALGRRQASTVKHYAKGRCGLRSGVLLLEMNDTEDHGETATSLGPCQEESPTTCGTSTQAAAGQPRLCPLFPPAHMHTSIILGFGSLPLGGLHAAHTYRSTTYSTCESFRL